jgi:hypothetical protein
VIFSHFCLLSLNNLYQMAFSSSSPSSNVPMATSSTGDSSNLSALTGFVDIRSYTIYISVGVASMLTQHAQVYARAPVPSVIMLAVIIAIIHSIHSVIASWNPSSFWILWKNTMLFLVQLISNIVFIVVGQLVLQFFTELIQRSNSSLELALHPIMWIVVIVMVAMIIISDTNVNPKTMMQSNTASATTTTTIEWRGHRRQVKNLEAELSNLKVQVGDLKAKMARLTGDNNSGPLIFGSNNNNNNVLAAQLNAGKDMAYLAVATSALGGNNNSANPNSTLQKLVVATSKA